SPFAAVFYPVEVLPAWMQWFSHLLPPSYVFEGMRAIVAGRAFSWDALAIGFGLAIVQIALAQVVFVRVFRATVKSGLLARYSAESVA
ncbi:MAG TPA: ABC transporter permease, partial [Rhodanobacteraceae bacterium]|nr:ABC transporter permease [Rhodanobacteraceae bacterium]